MKKYFTISVLMFSIASFCQPSGITQVNVTAVDGGININVVAQLGAVFSYVNHTYTIDDDDINLQVCYNDSPFPLETTVINDFFIPLTQANNYLINIIASFSSSPEICADITEWDTSSTTFLSVGKYDYRSNNIVLFPNPCKSLLTIQSDGTAIKNIEIYDNTGRLVKVSNEQINDVTHFNDGIYFIKLRLKDGGTFYKKFVKI